jgi:hypothetical protein
MKNKNMRVQPYFLLVNYFCWWLRGGRSGNRPEEVTPINWIQGDLLRRDIDG